jgi:transcription elongation factor Elf1
LFRKHQSHFQLQFDCPQCGEANVLDGPVRGSGRDAHFALTKCANLSCKTAPIEKVADLQNKLVLAIRKHIKKYYEGWIICEDPGNFFKFCLADCGGETTYSKSKDFHPATAVTAI